MIFIERLGIYYAIVLRLMFTGDESILDSGKGLVPSGNIPFPYPTLEIDVALWRHYGTIT